MLRNSSLKLDAFLSRLGAEPDHAIAKEAGVSRSLVISFRKKHNIAAYQGYKFGADNPPPAARAAAAKAPNAVRTPKPVKAAAVSADDAAFRGRRSALEAFVEQLGKLPDAEVAKLAHVTPENVRTYRTRRGIAASWPEAGKGRGGRPKAAGKQGASSAPPQVVVTPGARSIFTVSVDVGGVPRTYAVAAGNINDGVATANALVQKKHPGGSVNGISFVAEFLG